MDIIKTYICEGLPARTGEKRFHRRVIRALSGMWSFNKENAEHENNKITIILQRRNGDI